MKTSNLDTVIISTVRTPVGKVRGALAKVRSDDLLAIVFKEAVYRAQINPEDIEEAFAGCANQAGEDNRNVARMAVLLAGLPQTVPAVTINRLCASGLEAVVQASRAIKLGDISVALTGSVESMSRAPWVIQKPEINFPIGAPKMYDTSLGWRFENTKMKKLFPLEAMGNTAENLVQRYNISRKAQDEFALASHQKALNAQKEGLFAKEITPVTIAQKKGSAIVINKDEEPRTDCTLEKLASLKPAFKVGGSVSAGNSSTLNDGAASLVLTSREYAKSHGLKILARVLSSASIGVDPTIMGIGPVPATKKALNLAGLSIENIETIELNEAFAAQSLAVIEELGLDIDKVNQNGGAIALGHPLGCSGARILTTLLSVLEQKNATLGLATLCVGVGQGLSVIIERE